MLLSWQLTEVLISTDTFVCEDLTRQYWSTNGQTGQPFPNLKHFFIPLFNLFGLKRGFGNFALMSLSLRFGGLCMQLKEVLGKFQQG